MAEPAAPPWGRRLAAGLVLGGLLLLAWLVLQPFLVPALWAGILAHVTWPLFRRVHAAVRYRMLASLLMTLLVGATIIAPLVWLVLSLRAEVVAGYQDVVARWAAGQIRVPPLVLSLPVVGPEIQAWLERIGGNPALLGQDLSALVERTFGEMSVVLGDVGRNLAKFGFALLTLFFLYAGGEQLLADTRRVLRGLLDARSDDYLQAVGETTRAVVYGIFLTALVQGAVAGVGYWAVGLGAPLFLVAVTVVFALIPFGTPLVWGGLSVWLLAMDRPGAALGLFLYGALVVSWVDNLVRPLVISSATRMPFLLVLFGVLGGVAAFGLIGLFIGPVVLAVLMALWREWVEHAGGAPDRSC